MDECYAIANLIESARYESGNQFNKKIFSKNDISKEDIVGFFKNYFEKVLSYKLNDKETVKDKAISLSKFVIEHLTGDYEIGLAKNFEDIDEKVEAFSNVIAYSKTLDLEKILGQNKEKELANVLVDGAIATDIINIEQNVETKQKAKNNFEKSDDNFKNFFKTAIQNILNVNKLLANGIAHVTGMDKEESKGLNENLIGKFIGGIGYELLSGTLISKRHFTSIQNSESMQELISKEGILHFSSPANIEKIMNSGKVKKSNMYISDMTAPKSFFFAGAPKFEDLLINIPAYDVMTAVRIRPTEEQMEQLKYRALNDRAVVKDGDFEFEPEQAEIAYFGLMYDKEKDAIYLGEIDEEEAKDFKVSDEVKKAYNYKNKGNSILSEIKMNTYGLYAEYKHHQKLLQMEKRIRENGLESFRNVSDNVLVELGDIEEAYISTREKSVERKKIFDRIKLRTRLKNDRETNKDTLTKEESENGRDI